MNKGKGRERQDVEALDAGVRSPTLSPERGGSTGTPGKSRFLRRSRSRQFSEQSKDSSPPVAQDLPLSSSPPINLLDTSADSFEIVRPAQPATSTGPAARQSSKPLIPPPGRPSEDTGHRIGGWFTSMISPSASTSQVPSVDDAASTRSVSSASPSKLFKRSTNGTSSQKQENSTSNKTGSSSTSQPASRMAGLDRMLGRAMQYLTDSDSNADRCPDDIWLLGVRHDGWRSENDLKGMSARNGSSSTIDTQKQRRSSTVDSPEKAGVLPVRPGQTTSSKRRLSRSSVKSQSSGTQSQRVPTPSPLKAKSAAFFSALKGQNAQTSSQSPQRHSSLSPAGSPPTLVLARVDSGASSRSSARSVSRISSRTSTSSSSHDLHPPSPTMLSANTHSLNTALTAAQIHGWPASFYHDFYSRIQLTYRSGFPAIPSSPSTGNTVTHALTSMMSNLSASIGRSGNTSSTKEEGLTSDTGWGCMLRTGQSLLANALVDIHLGRDFRRPLPFVAGAAPADPPRSFGTQEQYATYVRLLTWFLDDPTAVSPFSIHRFAAEGKRLGKQVGEWFGPSTAAGAIKTLANGFAPANLGVALAIDTTVYQSEVLAVARGEGEEDGWNRPVLILVPLRLGINGVNPIYHTSIKQYFTLSQCVGIAGGRPSSSYYFIGAQADSLFYIDPHHTKPAVKGVEIPHALQQAAATTPLPSQNRSSRSDKWALDSFFASAYSMQDLESFHSDKVRKMSITGLDPSMLVGLLCRTREDWDDLCSRMKEIGRSSTPIVHIVAEMPKWMQAPSRSMSGTVGQMKPVSPTTSSVPAMSSTNPGEMEADEPVEYADSDDWDIDESDGGSILEKYSVEEKRSLRSISPKPSQEEEEDWTEATHRHTRDRTDGSTGSYQTASNSPLELLPGLTTGTPSPDEQEPSDRSDDQRDAAPNRIRQISDESERSQDTARQSLKS